MIKEAFIYMGGILIKQGKYKFFETDHFGNWLIIHFEDNTIYKVSTSNVIIKESKNEENI